MRDVAVLLEKIGFYVTTIFAGLCLLSLFMELHYHSQGAGYFLCAACILVFFGLSVSLGSLSYLRSLEESELPEENENPLQT